MQSGGFYLVIIGGFHFGDYSSKEYCAGCKVDMNIWIGTLNKSYNRSLNILETQETADVGGRNVYVQN